jgi:Rrf2 family protein
MQNLQSIAYAVHAVLLLERAEPGSPVPCSQLAVAGEMPERYLLQILRSLVNQGILESSRGADGGYLLARSVRKISLLDVSEALHKIDISQAKLKSELPMESRRPFQKALVRVAAATNNALARISIADLIPGGNSRIK